MRAVDYIITTIAGLFFAYIVVTPVVKFVEGAFNNAAERLEEAHRTGG